MRLSASRYEKNIEKLFVNARLKSYPKNQIVYYQGDPLSTVCLVKSGHLKAYTILDSGDNRSLFLLGAGDIFPIAFSLDLNWANYQVKYFYQTLTNVQLAVKDSREFKTLIDSSYEMMNIYLSYMTATNEAIINQLEMMKTKGAINKVAHLLPYLVDKLGEKLDKDTYRLAIKISHQEIADLTGLTRETTTQQIKKLENIGTIKQKSGSWYIYLKNGLDETLRA